MKWVSETDDSWKLERSSTMDPIISEGGKCEVTIPVNRLARLSLSWDAPNHIARYVEKKMKEQGYPGATPFHIRRTEDRVTVLLSQKDLEDTWFVPIVDHENIHALGDIIASIVERGAPTPIVKVSRDELKKMYPAGTGGVVESPEYGWKTIGARVPFSEIPEFEKLEDLWDEVNSDMGDPQAGIIDGELIVNPHYEGLPGPTEEDNKPLEFKDVEAPVLKITKQFTADMFKRYLELEMKRNDKQAYLDMLNAQFWGSGDYELK